MTTDTRDTNGRLNLEHYIKGPTDNGSTGEFVIRTYLENAQDLSWLVTVVYLANQQGPDPIVGISEVHDTEEEAILAHHFFRGQIVLHGTRWDSYLRIDSFRSKIAPRNTHSAPTQTEAKTAEEPEPTLVPKYGFDMFVTLVDVDGANRYQRVWCRAKLQDICVLKIGQLHWSLNDGGIPLDHSLDFYDYIHKRDPKRPLVFHIKELPNEIDSDDEEELIVSDI